MIKERGPSKLQDDAKWPETVIISRPRDPKERAGASGQPSSTRDVVIAPRGRGCARSAGDIRFDGGSFASTGSGWPR